MTVDEVATLLHARSCMKDSKPCRWGPGFAASIPEVRDQHRREAAALIEFSAAMERGDKEAALRQMERPR